MFKNFRQAVRDAYLDKKRKDELHFSEEWPSPGELRDWAYYHCNAALSRDDAATFQRFFNPSRIDSELSLIIRHFELDKLRPLRNFITGTTVTRPDENVVKLLAILIDFEKRPYRKEDWENPPEVPILEEEKEIKVTGKDENNGIQKDENPDAGIPTAPQEHSEVSKLLSETGKITRVVETDTNKTDAERKIWLFYGKYKFIVRFSAGTILVVCVFVAIYFLTPKQCMCWVKDQYIAVDCKDKAQINPVIAISHKLESFKKIMRADTLTLAHANRVWYSKINHEVEFFTGPGHHPTDSDRSLKAATEYILAKYAGKNAVLE